MSDYDFLWEIIREWQATVKPPKDECDRAEQLVRQLKVLLADDRKRKLEEYMDASQELARAQEMGEVKHTPEDDPDYGIEGKGRGSNYRPPAGTVCLISGPNCDDDKGYIFAEMTILWCNKTFVLYGKDGMWPNLSRWVHILCRPLDYETARQRDAYKEALEIIRDGLPHWGIEEVREIIRQALDEKALAACGVKS